MLVPGLLSYPGLTAYCMSKHANAALADVLRAELRKWNISGRYATKTFVHDTHPFTFQKPTNMGKNPFNLPLCLSVRSRQ